MSSLTCFGFFRVIFLLNFLYLFNYFTQKLSFYAVFFGAKYQLMLILNIPQSLDIS